MARVAHNHHNTGCDSRLRYQLARNGGSMGQGIDQGKNAKHKHAKHWRDERNAEIAQESCVDFAEISHKRAPAKKNTRQWCKGKTGRRHTLDGVKLFYSSFWLNGKNQEACFKLFCTVCGKILKTVYTAVDSPQYKKLMAKAASTRYADGQQD